jgi:Major Facilitator Superfamily
MALRSISNLLQHPLQRQKSETNAEDARIADIEKTMTPRQLKLHDLNAHARFAAPGPTGLDDIQEHRPNVVSSVPLQSPTTTTQPIEATGTGSEMPHLHDLDSPDHVDLERNVDYFSHRAAPQPQQTVTEPGSRMPEETADDFSSVTPNGPEPKQELPLSSAATISSSGRESPVIQRYTTALRHAPPKSYVQTLKPWNGRLTRAGWFRVAVRPFILFAYPSVLWSAMVYSLSVGWLIVLSESVSSIYRNKASYNYSALGTGLIYLSPFIGGVLGTVVAGRVSDIMIRYLSRRNGGVYEPEFRLIMAAPVMITTSIGLMGFGWSAQERDKWIVPTIFFGIISFGCSLGSTTAITFCVDSYRPYAGEALVTLNFSKNIFHGLVFSLFFPKWLQSDGSKNVFLAIGGIQVACLLTTIPLYIFGKRCRMWTVRKKLMEKF